MIYHRTQLPNDKVSCPIFNGDFYIRLTTGQAKISGLIGSKETNLSVNEPVCNMVRLR